MKLHWSPRSPFVRKVMIVAHERSVAGRIALVRTRAETARPHAELMRDNPLSKIPTLLLDDGAVLYDSRVICEYLDALDGAPKLFPRAPKARLAALWRQALGDGFLDLLVLDRHEKNRAQPSAQHLESAAVRKAAVLERLEREAQALTTTPFSIGHIAIGCALSYLDFRYPDEDWRKSHRRIANWHAAFCARPSARSTHPFDESPNTA